MKANKYFDIKEPTSIEDILEQIESGDLESWSREYLYETVETLDPEDNGGQPTLEMFSINTNPNNLIYKNLYVAGLASGVPTMFSCASGDGAKVACDIFKLWSGKIAVVHDVKA